MLQRWRTIGSTVSDLTGTRFEPHTSRSIEERVTVQPTGWFYTQSILKNNAAFTNAVFKKCLKVQLQI